jgi:hypothetical protein
MASRPSRRESFSDVVERVQRGLKVNGRPVRWPDPLGDGTWTDEQGTVWKLRGGNATEKRTEHLLRDPTVRVRHLYGFDEQRDSPPSDREDYWARILPYLRGRGEEPMRDFAVGEFKNTDGQSMLIIQESC